MAQRRDLLMSNFNIATLVRVLIACVIVGVYLWLNDQLWKEVVQKVLLK